MRRGKGNPILETLGGKNEQDSDGTSLGLSLSVLSLMLAPGLCLPVASIPGPRTLGFSPVWQPASYPLFIQFPLLPY